MVPSSLFLPVKIEVPMKTRFYGFSSFSTGVKIFLTGTFSQTFTGSPKFLRILFQIFSRVKIEFPRAENLYFLRVKLLYSNEKLFFSEKVHESIVFLQ